jgi:hypothetical protein
MELGGKCTLHTESTVLSVWLCSGLEAELGDALHRGRNRETFARFLDTLDGHEDFEVVPASPELFQRGVGLFRAGGHWRKLAGHPDRTKEAEEWYEYVNLSLFSSTAIVLVKKPNWDTT